MRTRPNFKSTSRQFVANVALEAKRDAEIAAGTLRCSCHGCSSSECSPTGHVVGCKCTEWNPEWDK